MKQFWEWNNSFEGARDMRRGDEMRREKKGGGGKGRLFGKRVVMVVT
jgi:hypothetical protein